jgi:hypothetical protein
VKELLYILELSCCYWLVKARAKKSSVEGTNKAARRTRHALPLLLERHRRPASSLHTIVPSCVLYVKPVRSRWFIGWSIRVAIPSTGSDLQPIRSIPHFIGLPCGDAAFSVEQACPICDKVLPKDGVEEFSLRPGSASLRVLGAPTLGLRPDDLLSVLRAGLGFWECQRANEDAHRDALTVSAAAERDRAVEAVRRMSAALEQEKLRSAGLRAEVETLRASVSDVERKYVEKARSARKISELYDDLRKVYRRLETDLHDARHVGQNPMYAENPRSPPLTPAPSHHVNTKRRPPQARAHDATPRMNDSDHEHDHNERGAQDQPRMHRTHQYEQDQHQHQQKQLLGHEIAREQNEHQNQSQSAARPASIPPAPRNRQHWISGAVAKRPQPIPQRKLASTYFGQPHVFTQQLPCPQHRSRPRAGASPPPTAQPAPPTRLASPRANIFDLKPNYQRRSQKRRRASAPYSVSPDARKPWNASHKVR